MRKDKEFVFFDNYDHDLDATRKFLFEEYGEDEDWESPEDVPDDEVWNHIQDEEQHWWDDVQDELSRLIDGKKFILKGSCGRWNGPRAAGAIIESFKDLSPAWTDCDYINLTDNNGHFHIKCSHHDGDNNFELRELTKTGREYLERHGDTMDDRELHTKLFEDSHYSKLPQFAKHW